MNKFKIILSGTVFVFLVCIFTLMQESCTYNELEDPKKVVNFCDTVNATYSGSIKAIIATECGVSDCHDAGFIGADFSTYDGVKIHIDNGKFNSKVFINSTMPPGGFKKAVNKDILKCWLDKGALNN